MPDEHLIATTPQAPWLPPGSSAEVWAGDNCDEVVPAIIVRLLLVRGVESGEAHFFCVPTAKGLDLPSRFLAEEHERARPSVGLAPLLHDVLGTRDVATRCVGYVRNVVPVPDAGYPHPTPWAHVPVFATAEPVEPVADGDWTTVEQAPQELRTRHWWPIVADFLGAA